MYRSLRRVVSRTLMRLRISVFGNNHSFLLNHRYRSYHRASKKHFRPMDKARLERVSSSVEQFRRDGFLVLPSTLDAANATALKQKVDGLFDSGKDVLPIGHGLQRLIDGIERLPEITNLIDGQLADIVEGYFGSHFKLYNASFYRIVPNDTAPASSFLWHFDNSPDEEIKLMIYLDDVTEETGAFRFKSLEISERARARGFWHRDDYNLATDIFDEPSTTVVAEGRPGTAILFRQGRVVHKATAPIHLHRDVVTMVIIPSLIPWREHFARNRHLLSTNAGLCLNPWTDEPENIGYRY